MVKRHFFLLASLCLPMLLLWELRAGFIVAKAELTQKVVIISEVAWMGTASDPINQWLELYNNGDASVDLTGWKLIVDQVNEVLLGGELESRAFFLLENRDDDTIRDIPADILYSVGMNNAGGSLLLVDENGNLVDTANIAGGHWPAGDGHPHFRSMERRTPAAPDTPDGWVSNDMVTRNGLDAALLPINGTPKQPNSSWNSNFPLADLEVSKWGPATAIVNGQISYTIALQNSGHLTATAVIVTDTLPGGFTYLSDESGLPVSQPIENLIVWDVGDLPSGAGFEFELSVFTTGPVDTIATNQIVASTACTETDTADNQATTDTLIIDDDRPAVLIDAVLYDGYERFDPEEAVRLINVGPASADLGGWSLSDGVSTAIFPSPVVVEPGQGIWIARRADAFIRHFGHPPDFELQNPGDPAIPNLLGGWPELNNDGDHIWLSDAGNIVQDVLVFEQANGDHPGWSGPSLEPYQSPGLPGASGQVLYRMRDQATGLPVPDTNRAVDWAQSGADPINGRRLRYPGWDLDEFFFTHSVTETAELVVAIAPDNAYSLVAGEIASATTTIQIETLTFRSPAIADLLIDAAQRGVTVTVLLEAHPAGGVDEQQRLNCLALAASGGRCWAMASIENYIRARYDFLHAKFILIDGQRVVIGTENLSPDSMPNDVHNGSFTGRRGVLLATDAPGVVARIQEIWRADFDPIVHQDIRPWPEAIDYATIKSSPAEKPVQYRAYVLHFPEPGRFFGTFGFEVIQSPENSLRDQDGLLGLLARAGEGDTLLIQQLDERPYWGPTQNPTLDPNPRLESYISAARRGAKVRLLLDNFFESSRLSNATTCLYINAIAQLEQLDLRCVQANPTGLGLHAKVILAHIGGKGFIHVGSINGSELSNKGNREIALQVQSNQAFDWLAGMFYADWPHLFHLPVIFSRYSSPANHLLISEVLYDPEGDDSAEFIELVNPTAGNITLDGYSIGDAVSQLDNEDVRQFPSGLTLLPGETLIIATTATAFHTRYGSNPDLEIWPSDPLVPDLIDDPGWGTPGAFIQLANDGDEVILRNANDQIIDAMAYGSGLVPGLSTCPLVSKWDHSLERYPYWRDTNDCAIDFREWPFPNPGSLP